MIKGKVTLMHNMMVYRRSRGRAPFILNLGVRQTLHSEPHTQPLYPWVKNPHYVPNRTVVWPWS